MVHIIFDPSNGSIVDQTGDGHFRGLSNYQRGYGHFVGLRHQRGAGLGDIFRRFWRVLKPIAKTLAPIATSAGKALGEEGLATTARVLSDVVQGGNLKESVQSQGREGVRKLFGRAEKSLTGSGRKRGYKRKRNNATNVILKPVDDFVGRLVPQKVIAANKKKRQRIDNLGNY